uniref:Uncharacterized protein n=1 Tax=Arundo donax TaxID=35708 RepID=A0A0A8ZUK8_ARUDO
MCTLLRITAFSYDF